MAIYHLKHPHKKHEENSLRGIRAAAKARKWIRRGLRLVRVRKFTEVDLDLLITKADPHCPHCAPGKCVGHVVGCHWDEPMVHDGFYDPGDAHGHKLPKHTRVRDMTLEEVLRLRARTRGRIYHISTVEQLLAECATQGIGARLEPKDDARFEQVSVWTRIKAYADKVGAVVRGYSLRNFGGKGAGTRRVAAMNKAHIPAHTIH